MKKIVFLIQLLIIIQVNNPLYGQDKKFKIQAGGILAHFIKIEEGSFTAFPGYYNFPVTPGAEIVLSGEIISGVTIGTGVNYQYGNVSSYVNDIQKRFHFEEVSIPVLLQKTFISNEKKEFYCSAGVYFGKMISVKADYNTSFGWEESSDITDVAFYSDDKSLSDLYFDLGYSTPLSSKFDISFSPFLKYRINTTWLNHHHKKVHYGVKVNVSLKL